MAHADVVVGLVRPDDDAVPVAGLHVAVELLVEPGGPGFEAAFIFALIPRELELVPVVIGESAVEPARPVAVVGLPLGLLVLVELPEAIDRPGDLPPVVVAVRHLAFDALRAALEGANLFVQRPQSVLIGSGLRVVLNDFPYGIPRLLRALGAKLDRDLVPVFHRGFNLAPLGEHPGEAVDRVGGEGVLGVVLILRHLRPRLERLIRVAVLLVREPYVVEGRPGIFEIVGEVVENLVVFLGGGEAAVPQVQRPTLAEQGVGDQVRSRKLKDKRVVLRGRPLEVAIARVGEELVGLVDGMSFERAQPLHLGIGNLWLVDLGVQGGSAHQHRQGRGQNRQADGGGERAVGARGASAWRLAGATHGLGTA